MEQIIIDGFYRIGLSYEPEYYADCDKKCICRDLALVKKILSNGSNQYRIQCRDCGRNVRIIKEVAAFSAERSGCKLGQWDNSFEEKRAEQWEKRTEDIRAKQVQQNAEWWERYEEYIRSDQWKLIRDKILARDNFFCQGCLSEQATQVHHLTYQNVTKELAFELISLCNNCHNRIHNR